MFNYTSKTDQNFQPGYSNSRPSFPREAFFKNSESNPNNLTTPKLHNESLLIPQTSEEEDKVRTLPVFQVHQSKHLFPGKVKENSKTCNYAGIFSDKRSYLRPEMNSDIRESLPVNKMPYSPISVKQIKASITAKSNEKKSDIYHLSTEPSDSHSNHASSQGFKEASFQKESIEAMGNQLKAPSHSKRIRICQLSVGSINEMEKRNSYSSPKTIFHSDSKDFRSRELGKSPPNLKRTSLQLNPNLLSETSPKRGGLIPNRETPVKLGQMKTNDWNETIYYTNGDSHQKLSSQTTFKRSKNKSTLSKINNPLTRLGKKQFKSVQRQFQLYFWV